jgi:hypothetical protein
MLEVLLNQSVPIVLSGYTNRLYNETLKGWELKKLQASKIERGAAGPNGIIPLA